MIAQMHQGFQEYTKKGEKKDELPQPVMLTLDQHKKNGKKLERKPSVWILLSKTGGIAHERNWM